MTLQPRHHFASPMTVRLLRWIATLGAVLSPTLPAAENAGGAPPDETAAWHDASLNLFNRAHHTLAALSREEPTRTRFTRLGEALTLLNLQPKTPANVERAEALLAALRAEDYADEAGISAAYHLARIAQWHREPRNPADALVQYDALADRFPAHPLGQLSVIKALVIRLYDRVTPDEARRRLAVADSLAPRLRHPALLSEYHQVLATAGARFGMDPAWRLPHLMAAERLGVMRFNENKDFILATAETALTASQREIALKYYERFLTAAPRDERTAYVRERYEALRAGKKLP